MPLQLGRTIIFDIFPTTEEGYFHDLTRTWSLAMQPTKCRKHTTRPRRSLTALWLSWRWDVRRGSIRS